MIGTVRTASVTSGQLTPDAGNTLIGGTNGCGGEGRGCRDGERALQADHVISNRMTQVSVMTWVGLMREQVKQKERLVAARQECFAFTDQIGRSSLRGLLNKPIDDTKRV